LPETAVSAIERRAKAAEFSASGGEIYHGNIPEGAKEHH
jgi:hypothetical protein